MPASPEWEDEENDGGGECFPGSLSEESEA